MKNLIAISGVGRITALKIRDQICDIEAIDSTRTIGIAREIRIRRRPIPLQIIYEVYDIQSVNGAAVVGIAGAV